MNKFISIAIILILVFFASTSFADVTTYTKGSLDENGVRKHYWTLRDTDTGGIVTGDASGYISGRIEGVRLIPDDTANLVITGDYQPTIDWDGKVLDQYGYDVIEGVGADVTNLFTTTRQYRTPVTTDSSGNNVGYIYLNGVKLRGYASGLGDFNACIIEISIKEEHQLYYW